MMSGECDRQRSTLRLLEHDRASRSVLPVGAHPLGHRESGSVQNRRHRPGDRPDRRSQFAHIVQERSLDRFPVVSEESLDASGDSDGMTLIGTALGPEQVRARFVEMVMHELLIFRTGWHCSQMAEESCDQVPGGAKTLPHDDDLHLTHSRDVGRYAIRSAPMGAPQCSQVP